MVAQAQIGSAKPGPLVTPGSAFLPGDGTVSPFRSGRAVTPTRTRSALARVRAREARHDLGDCHFCAHHCGVNRLAGELGLCRAGSHARWFLAQTEVNDEPGLAPCFAIALSGCDLRCDFCVSGVQSWNPDAGEVLDAAEIARRATQAVASGARSVMIFGGEPTVHLPAALDLVALLPDNARLIWKTNAHGTDRTRALLDGLFDIWVADYKFGNDDCAARLARVPNYTAVVRENLTWAAARTRLIVRHLLMPGHVECCWKPVAGWLASELPEATVSLRGGFWPGWHSARHPELRRTTTGADLERALQIAQECGLQTQP